MNTPDLRSAVRHARSIVILGALLAVVPAAHAQLYKWVDDSGVVNYGDWPPAGVKVQPVTGGTVSSVADRALVAAPASAPDATRAARRTAAPGASPRGVAPASNAAAAPGNASSVATDVPYDTYGRRPVAVEAAVDRRPLNAPVRRPMLPIDAVPDLPPRPR